MSKTDLQSTTHGGGRVLSVILAGTLAMGMTPAVALTSQSLEPVQAFADVPSLTQGYKATLKQDATPLSVTYGGVVAGGVDSYDIQKGETGSETTVTLTNSAIAWYDASGNEVSSGDLATVAAGTSLTPVITGSDSSDSVTIPLDAVTVAKASATVSATFPKDLTHEGEFDTKDTSAALSFVQTEFAKLTPTVNPTTAGTASIASVAVSDYDDSAKTQVLTATYAVSDSNYTTTSTAEITVGITEAPVQETEVNISDIMTIALPEGVATSSQYNGSVIAVPGLNVTAPINGVTTTIPSSAYTVEVQQDGTEVELKNAGTYQLVVKINDNAEVNGVKISGEANFGSDYTVTKAPLSITAPEYIPAGTTMTDAAKMFAVSGVVAADQSKAAEIYSVTATNSAGADTDASVGDTITGTLDVTDPASLPGSNYEVKTATDTATVPKAITVNNVSYAVTLAPNDQRPGVTAESGFDYSYNSDAQAPNVVFTNMTTGKAETPAGVTTLYAAETSTPGTYANGATSPRAAVGNYQITVEYGSGATKQSVVVGTYSITEASLSDASEILITWNGEPVQTGAKVTMNNADQWESALKVVYPSNGVAVAYPSAYSVTFGTNQLTIAPAAPSAPGMVVPVVGGPVELTYSLANYQIGSAAVSADFLKEVKPTYKNAQIGVDEAQANKYLVVKNASGVVVPYESVYYATDGKNFNLPADVTVDQFNAGTTTVTIDGETYNCQVMKNWTITNGENKNAGEATVTVTGTNNYAGQAIATFTIAPRNVADLVLNVQGSGFTYNAQEQNPDVQVTAADSTVNGLNQTVKAKDNKSKDFTVSYSNNVNATTPTTPAIATITAASSNYTGSKTVNFEIAPYDLTGVGSTTAANLPFTSNTAAYNADILSVTSGLTIKDIAVPMTAGVDYKVVQNTNKNTTVSNPWTDLGFSDDVQGEQEELHYAVVGQGNYTGAIYGDYYVTENAIGKYIKAASAPIQYFDGTELEPDITITLNEGEPFIGTDEALAAAGLTVTYANNRNASTQATFTISASGATSAETGEIAYYGSWPTRNFTILPSDLTGASFALLAPENGTQFEYTGSQIKPEVSVDLKEKAPLYVGVGVGDTRGILTTEQGTQIKLENIEGEYAVSYGANTAVGTKSGSVTLTSTSANMTNAATEAFEIVAATIEEDDVVVSDKGVYKVQANGASFAEPDKVTVTVNDRVLVRDVDYTLTVGKNQKVGEASSWVITGIGNYTGSVSGTFQVVNDIATADITMPTEVYIYDGTPKEPLPTITIKSGNDTTILKLNEQYELDYENNVNAGTATVIIKGYGDEWGGSVEKTFTIEQAAGDLDITGAVANYTYTGVAATPEPDFTFTVGDNAYTKADLEAGVDYKYVYTNNVDSSAVSGKKATVSVEMMGNYGAKDPEVVEFTIEQANVANAEVVVGDVVKGGTPKVAVSMGGRALVQGTDYTFSADTKTVGTKTATITGKGNYTGTQKVTFTVLNENQVPADPEKPITGTGWKKSASGKWQYVDANGKLVSSGWQSINGKWYHFDSKGYAETGWQQIGGAWYYLYTAADAGKTECSMATGWAFVDGHWFYFAPSGAMQTGWQQIGGAWYYLNTQHDGTFGAMKTGWQWIDNNWFYFAASGAMQTGWQSINGAWYLLNTQHDGTFGAMLTGWQRVDHATGAPTSANSWYYLTPGSGALATNTWIGNYYVDSTGYWVY